MAENGDRAENSESEGGDRVDGIDGDVMGEGGENTAADFEALKRDFEDLKNRFIRLQADFENYRKRVLREKEEWRERAVGEVAAVFLDVLDDFERALCALEREGGGVGSSVGDGVREGIAAIHRKIIQGLNSIGIRRMETIGKPFDHNLHEAVMVRRDNVEEEVVVEEVSGGYMIGEKVLRPAKVVVAVPEDRGKENKDDEKDDEKKDDTDDSKNEGLVDENPAR